MNAKMENSFLNGNFAPVLDEINTPCNNVIGEIPKALSGHFLRIGPNPQYAPLDPERYHWFDGDGMIHDIHFEAGKANYQNRWVRTKGFNIEREEGKAIWKGFQSLHELEFHHGLMTKNVANTALVWHANKLLALWEAGLPHRLSLDSLETLGEENFDGAWDSAFTAHPKVCPETGEMITFGYNVIGDFGFTHGVFDKEGKLKHKAQIKLKRKSVMIHDCAITPDYTLILDMPVTFSIERAMAGGEAFAWEPENGARIGVLPRFGMNEDVRWFDVEVGYIFHVFNAWQEGDEVILEACRSDSTSVLAETEEDASASSEKARPYQYRMNMKTGTVVEKPIDELACEFSRINENFIGKKNQFVYASRFSANDKAPRFDALVKFDRKNNTRQVFEFDTGIYSGEFVFAPRNNSVSEDDGFLLGFVHNENTQQSEMYILDTKRFTDGPVARIIMPARVPYGFHAAWVEA